MSKTPGIVLPEFFNSPEEMAKEIQKRAKKLNPEAFSFAEYVRHADLGSNFLEHYGVKGMKWGVRRSRTERKAASEGKPLAFKRITPKPGGGQSLKRTTPKPSADKAEANQVMTRVGKKGNTSALSNNDLKKLNERMRLEQEFTRLSGSAEQSRGQKFVKGVMKQDANIIAQTGNIQNTKTVQIAKTLGKTAAAANEIRGDIKTYKKYKNQAQNR